MVEAAGVELDWRLRQSPPTGELWPQSAAVRCPGEHAAPGTRDVAGNSTLFCGAHGEAAGTVGANRSIGYDMTVMFDGAQTKSPARVLARIAPEWRGSELRAITDWRYATSMSARGFLAAIINRVRAAPEGARRPCSHS